MLTNIRNFGDAKVGDKYAKHTFYHAASMEASLVKNLKPTQEVEEFILVSEGDVKDIAPYSKVKGTEGYDYHANKVMFDDEIGILKKIFKEYAKL